MNSAERRSSLQDGVQLSILANIKTFGSNQVALAGAIQTLLIPKPAEFVNPDIQNAAIILQDVLLSIDKEGNRANRFVEGTQHAPFLETPLGQQMMEDTRVANIFQSMREAITQAIHSLKAISYPAPIDVKYTDSSTVPNLNIILKSLESDTRKAKDVLTKLQKVFPGCKGQWDEIKLEIWKKVSSNDPTQRPTDTGLVLRLAWDDDKFQMDPQFVGGFQARDLDAYESTMVKAGASLLPRTVNDQNTPKDARRTAVVDFEADLLSYFETLNSPVTNHSRIEELERQIERLQLPELVLQRWKEVKNAFNLFGSLPKQPLRLCVFGPANQGKSSFINALIGQRILQSQTKEATAWPVLVRHRKGDRFKSPILTIEKGSLDPFLSFLRNEKFSQMLDPNDDRCSDDAYVYQKMTILAAGSLEMDSLKEFEKDDSKFDVRTENTAQKPHAVRDTITQLNMLVRWCWKLCADGKDLPVTTNVWPTIDVEFAFFAESDEKIEILDCPGTGEHGTKSPENLMETCLKSCLDGSLSLTMATSVRANPWTRLLEKAQSRTRRRPLAVYLTHMDQMDDKDEASNQKDASNAVYQECTEDTLRRVHLCSPGKWINSHRVLQGAGVDSIRMGPDREISVDDWPQERPAFELLIDATTESSFLKTIYVTSKLDLIKKKYNRPTGYDDLRNRITDYLNEYNLFPTVAHFKSCALEDGCDRRKFRQLSLVHKALQDLLRAQKDLADFAMNRQKNLPQQKADHDKLTVAASFQWRLWMKEWDAHKDKATITLDTNAKSVDDLAKVAVKKAIQGAIDGQQGSKPKSEATIDGTITINDLPMRGLFLHNVKEALLRELEGIQDTHFIRIRHIAKTEWRGLMRSLASEGPSVGSPNNGSDSTIYTRDEIISVLKDVGDDMETAVYAYLIRNARKTVDPVPMDEIKAMQDLLHEKNLPYIIACADAQNKAINLPSGLDLVAQEVATKVNEFGFMFRLWIPVANVVPDLVLQQVWDQAACSGDIATVDIKALTSKVIEVFVQPWMEVMKKEARTTLEGTISHVHTIANVAMNRFLDRRGSYLKAAEALSLSTRPDHSELPGDPAITDFVRQLMTWNAHCNAFYGLVNGVCSEWARLINPKIQHVDSVSDQADAVAVSRMTEISLFEDDAEPTEVFVPDLQFQRADAEGVTV